MEPSPHNGATSRSFTMHPRDKAARSSKMEERSSQTRKLIPLTSPTLNLFRNNLEEPPLHSCAPPIGLNEQLEILCPAELLSAN